MICYDKRYLRTSRVNTIVEPHIGKDEEGNEVTLGYIYCDKTTYTDCILLQSKFDGNLQAMISQLAPSEKHIGAINYFFENAPKPFNMLAPYLGLMSTSIQLENDMEDLVSRLFVISKSVGFNSFIQVPKNLRMNLIFSASEFNRYKADVDDYKKFMYETMKDESPSEVIYINSEEVERFGQFITLFRDMGIIGATSASYNSSDYKGTVSSGGELDMSYDPTDISPEEVDKAVASGAVPKIDFGALFGEPAGGSASTTPPAAPAASTPPAANNANVGAFITEDDGVEEENEVDILDRLTTGIENTASML